MTASVQAASETRYYRISGMTLASCFELPGAASTNEPSAGPDAVVKYDQVPASLPDAIQHGPNWEVGPSGAILRVPGRGRFLIRDGREVLCDTAPGKDAADLAIFILGSVLGVMLHQQSCYVLHASAVAVDGHAMLFCGSSGAGKSVLAAALSSAGYPLVSDDLCRIRFDEGEPRAIPDGRSLKLWSDTVKALSLEQRQGLPVRAGIRKYWVDPPSTAVATPLPVRAIYFLCPAKPPHAAGIKYVTLLDGASLLRSHAYRPRLVRALGLDQQWLSASVSLLKMAPAWKFTREWRLDALDGCVRMLEEHWRS